MKKKHWIIVIVALLLLTAVISALLFFNQGDRIQALRVEKIEVGDYELSASESIKFISLYNAAEYAGEGNGEGGTAEYMVYVRYRDGSFMIIREFNGRDRNFEITTHDQKSEKVGWFYVYSEKLETFVESLLEKK